MYSTRVVEHDRITFLRCSLTVYKFKSSLIPQAIYLYYKYELLRE